MPRTPPHGRGINPIGRRTRAYPRPPAAPPPNNNALRSQKGQTTRPSAYGSDTGGRLCGRGGLRSRSGPCGGPRRGGCWPTGPHGTDPRPGSHAGRPRCRRHGYGPRASLPGTISNSWPASTSTIEVHRRFCGRLRGAVRKNMVSSTPTASTAPIRSSSASNRAWPQRMTSLLMRMPITAQLLGVVGHRPPLPAHHLRRPPGGPAGQQPPLRSNPGILLGKPESTPQPLSGHSNRRFLHPSRTGRRTPGGPPAQPASRPGPHPPATPRTQRTGHPDGAYLHQQSPVRGSLTFSISTSPNPAITSHMRLYLHSTRGPPSLGKHFSVRLWRTPPQIPRIPYPLSTHHPPSTPKSPPNNHVSPPRSERGLNEIRRPGRQRSRPSAAGAAKAIPCTGSCPSGRSTPGGLRSRRGF